MPQSYPSYSTQRHGSRRSRRSGESSRDRHVRHQPFAEQREKHKRWKVIRGHLVAMTGEFLGTVLFLWFAFAGTQVAAMTSPEWTSSRVILVSLSFGFSLLVTVWAFYRISGGLFNPAVTLAMMLTKTLPWVRGLVLFPAQIVGGIVASALVSCMFPGPLGVATRLGQGTSITQGVFIEMFATSLLVFTILMLAAEKHTATFIAPVGIGLALFVAELATVLFTGGSLNPARAFGPDVVLKSFAGYHYIYWFGPIMGGLLAAAYYKFCKHFHYEDANPGQDAMNPQDAEK